MDDQKQLDMDQFRDLVGANRIRMASSDSLMEKCTPAGAVSVLACYIMLIRIFKSF